MERPRFALGRWYPVLDSSFDADHLFARGGQATRSGEWAPSRRPHQRYDAVGPSVSMHRLIGGDRATGDVIRGDHNPAPGPWAPRPSNIVGLA